MANLFTQLVLIVGRITSNGVQMLGTGFLVTKDGRVATTRHVVGTEDANLVVLVPHITDINEFQDLSDTSCRQNSTNLRIRLRFSALIPRRIPRHRRRSTFSTAC